MYPVSANFHTLSIADAPKTRIRIYFITDSVDCTDDNDVQTNGTLLVGAVGDTDSNKRIAENGVSFNEMFNSDLNLSVGATVSSQIGLTLINKDGALNNFGFGRCKVYLDVCDSANAAWLSCPMGVYDIALPTKRRVQLVTAVGYDQMQKLDTIADTWWNDLNWPNGITVSQVITDLATELGVSLSATALTNILNGSVSFSAAPFNAVETTYREILAYIAGVTGTIARFDRNGALDFRWFSEAQIGGNTATIDGDTVGNQVFSIDLAEYACATVDALQVKVSTSDVGVTVGTGDNVYSMIGNPLMGGDSTEITNKATPIYTRINGLGTYNPITARCIMDWSIEAGDIVELTYGNDTYTLPIFQQNMVWRGGFVVSDLISSGDQTQPTTSKEIRSDYRNDSMRHEFEVTLESLRSLIQSIDGNYTLIEQTVNQIEQVVAAQGITIRNILDPTGEIWTAIQTNANDIGAVGDALNADITERQSYIRFIPAEPAIVLGVSDDNQIKLKLVNDKIYFFNGADDSTDLSLAYAYFNSQEAWANRFVAGQSVQIGADTATARWVWKTLSNDDLVLEMM